MSALCRLISSASLAVALPLATVALAAAPSGPSPEAARLDTYTRPGGETYFSLSLTPDAKVPPAPSHEVVVLLDTSASQVGPYREKALAAFEAMLARLDANDRVRLLAVDLDAVPMSEDFIAPGSAEMKAALAKLKARVPLGSTDMALALRAGIDSFGKASTAARSIVYIGDGISSANLLEPAQFADLVRTLVGGRIAVSSYAVGPQSDSHLLAALANQTGGMLAISREMVWASDAVDGKAAISQNRASQENARRAGEAGVYLAKAADGLVLWPTETNWPEAFAEVYPATMPPLRGDRDTVIIGKGKLTGSLHVGMTVEVAGKATQLAWNVHPQASNPDQAYLVQLVESARSDRGVTLPTVGTAGLEETRRMIDAEVENLNVLARQAVATGNLPGAELFAKQALKRDPGNPVALAVQGGVKKLRLAGRSGVANLKLVNLAQAVEPQNDSRDTAALGEAGQDGAFLETFDDRTRLITGQVQAEVEAKLSDARRRMATEPTSVIQNLKLTLQNVKRVPELDPEVRAQLADRISSALREADRREMEKEEIDRQAQERRAAGEALAAIAQHLTRKEQRTKQLMDRLTSLMDQQQYQSAAEEVAPEVLATDPGSPAATSAVATSGLGRNIAENEVNRVARNEGYLNTLATAERSSIPTPDDPPIIYPDAEVWRELTERRKEFAATDLSKRGSAEQKISKALKAKTNVQFIETPLEDVMATLERQHEIEIVLDKKALSDVGIGSDAPITISLSGITLRSALRLMLRDLDLTYIIRDEVLLITTTDEAQNNITTKVYPVADLVIPIIQLSAGGGGGIGGGGIGGGGGGFGGGGFGGGGGGFGGGGFGGGGGGFGGGGFGGGGGFFSVPDDLAPKTESTGLTATPAERSASRKSISINEDESVKPERFWKDYFATHRADPAAVRQTVRDLTKARQLDHVVALIQGALRGGQPQPWMYEAMSLAMQLDNQPEAEIERALMSAADFAQSADQLLYLARYFERIGRDARALQVYQQMAKVEPTRQEPYMQGLEVAKRLDDLEGIRWATIGAIGQAWIGDEAKTMQSAIRTAHATLSKLEKTGNRQEADTYRKALDEALIRDCIVHVTWTGEADVDLLVEEPSGTICSLGERRTVAGGVMLGDIYGHADRSTPELSSETYVCPRGFSGEYRVLLRRVWGQVTAGKVTVDIYLHYRTKNVLHERRQVALGDADAVLVFNLDEGRRREPLNEQQVATAAASQLAVSRAVLAQQISSLSDPGVTTARPIDVALAGRGVIARGGAVGFQPITITLPEGTNLIATAVVSADRRYVRITAAPLFSSIGNVTTFTFQGTGGQGAGAGFGGGGGGLGGGGFGGGGFGGGGGGLGGGGFGGGGF